MIKDYIISHFFDKRGHLKTNLTKYQNILNDIHIGETLKEKIYCILNDITEYKKCPICHSNNLKFINIKLGYAGTCSDTKCINKHRANSIKESTLKKYRC